MNEPTCIKLKPGGNGRYKYEVFPRIWLYSDKPSLWQRIGTLVCLGKRIIKLPDIATCDHNYINKKRRHHATDALINYKECSICEHDVELL
jgi:hypothetical protein